MSDNTPINPENPAFVPHTNWALSEIMSEAWQLTDGFKRSYLGAGLIYIGILLVLSVILGLLLGKAGVTKIIADLIIGLATYPLAVGLMIIAIKRSVGIPVNAMMVFDYYPKTIPIFLLYVLMILLIIIGLMLLILPGIYLAIAYSMAPALLVDKNMGIWEALETSRKAITPHWFKVFALFLICAIILIVSALPLGIGLIWSMPFFALVMAIVYRNLVGVSLA